MDEAEAAAAYVADFSKLVTGARNRGRKVGASNVLLGTELWLPWSKDENKQIYCISHAFQDNMSCVTDTTCFYAPLQFTSRWKIGWY